VTLGSLRRGVTAKGRSPLVYDGQIENTDREVNMTHDTAKSLVGDGEAKVTVSLTLKEGAYGDYSAFTSVTLTCDQSLETLEKAHELATGLASMFISEDIEEARKLYEGRQGNSK
jgi:hypothetical protein